MSVETASQTTELQGDPGELRARYFDLFLISFLILFFELASIRWFGSNVIFLTFFTNLVLMACFLGMSVGLLSAGRRQNLITWVFPMALLAAGLAVATLGASTIWRKLLIDVGGQNSPQQVFFGTEMVKAPNPSQFVVPIEVMAALFFVLISLTFIGLGQVMGRAFAAIPNRVVAYSVDILGSLTGIVIFGLMSLLRTPPVLWYAIGTVIIFRFLPRLTWFQAACAIVLVGGIGLMGYYEGARRVTIWSPYYKVYYNAKTGVLTTNNLGHQQMVPVGESGAAYMLPHLLNRDAGNAPFGRAMIIGAGSGVDRRPARGDGEEGLWGRADRPLPAQHALDPSRRLDGHRQIHLRHRRQAGLESLGEHPQGVAGAQVLLGQRAAKGQRIYQWLRTDFSRQSSAPDCR